MTEETSSTADWLMEGFYAGAEDFLELERENICNAIAKNMMAQIIEFGCERYELEGENEDIVTVSVNIPGISENVRLSFKRSRFEEIMGKDWLVLDR